MEPPKTKRKAQGGPKSGKKRQKTASAPKKAVAVDALSWKAVEVPEMFNDAEGFYGLEEVTGVTVVRNGNQLSFHAASQQDSPVERDCKEEEEFKGFDDDGDEDDCAIASSKPTGKDSNNDPVKSKKSKKEKSKKEKAAKKEAVKTKAKKKKGPKEEVKHVSNEGEETDVSEWAPLNLSTAMLSAIASLSFSAPTSIQKAAIPEIRAGHDVIGKASTGSGKTLAFGIPIVENWLQHNKSEDESEPKPEPEEDQSEETQKIPTALILSPTRELAHQLTAHIKSLCSSLSPSPYVCSVTGGLSVFKQQRQLRTADIVVGTPGRLWEVISSSNSLLDAFKKMKFLVVDEADRLLSEGHFKEASEILKALDRYVASEGDRHDESQLTPRQTLVFSATFNKSLQQKLAGKGRYDLMTTTESMEYLLKKLNFREESPKFLDMNPISQMAQRLQEGLVECGAMEKDLYLYALLLHHPGSRSLVFTNSIGSVRRLAPFLQMLQVNALALHSQMPQKARMRSLERFTATSSPGKSSVLIATDVAARGLDIKDIDLVIHYHVPRAADAYVHRSGRTARASSSGKSILLCAPEEAAPTRKLVAKVHARNAPSKGSGKNFYVRTLDLDRRLVNRLKPRVVLAKTITDAAQAKERGGKDDQWLRSAADELGVEYDSESLEKAGNWGGRGSGRRLKEAEARQLTKVESGQLKAELRGLLAQRINAGVSTRFITGGGVDVEELLKGGKGDFLGNVGGLGFD